MSWKIMCIQTREGTKLDKYLGLGWEPFAVVIRPDDGEHLIYLKKKE